MIKKICKILMAVFMAVGIYISISNLLLVELEAGGDLQLYDPFLNDCIGPPGQCEVGIAPSKG